MSDVADDVFAYMQTEEFADRCRELNVDIAAGHDISLVEMSERLKLPGKIFADFVTVWAEFRTGGPVEVTWYDGPEAPVAPIPRGRPN